MRSRQVETGQGYQQALNDLRHERHEHRGRVLETPVYAAGKGDGPVPGELTRLVRHHSYWVSHYLNDAVHRARYTKAPFFDWRRMTLYHLTDALEHLNLLIGTITAYLINELHLDPAQVRSHLQASNHKDVEAFITPSALEHVAGLTGKPSTGDRISVWHQVGTSVASGTGWSDARTEDALEIVLAAVFANYPDDDSAFDNLPEPLRARALAVHGILYPTDPSE
ncbi:hypothetical protein [Streptomyces sp. G1]|uniref:hypothetical protein n=1 Tax=Streptomyces sp. G1 TaxID=361572 RepID=UPI00202F8D6A|nr:hypothetical protein [Streptomyces sp. G1]MCM1967961.1 hypothetical protein [Streptomyces sp. G1]